MISSPSASIASRNECELLTETYTIMKPSTEFKILHVRECATEPFTADAPEKAAAYWNTYITKADWFDPMKEAVVILALNTRNRVIGHNFVTLGGLDSCVIQPREVFRPLIMIAARCGILMHNHPSGDPIPSQADINCTRDMVSAGKLLRIPIVDHVIVGGEGKWTSLRQIGVIPPE